MEQKKYLDTAGKVLNEVDRRAKEAGRHVTDGPDKLYIALQGLSILCRRAMSGLLDGLVKPETMDEELDRIGDYIGQLKEQEATNDHQPTQTRD